MRISPSCWRLLKVREVLNCFCWSSVKHREWKSEMCLCRFSTEYEGFVKGGASLPSLVCVITGNPLLPNWSQHLFECVCWSHICLCVCVCVCAGKGPQKEHYRKLIDLLQLEHVRICTPWLEAEDYPVLLGTVQHHTLYFRAARYIHAI